MHGGTGVTSLHCSECLCLICDTASCLDKGFNVVNVGRAALLTCSAAVRQTEMNVMTAFVIWLSCSK